MNIRKFLIIEWAGMDVIKAEEFKLTENGTEFYTEGRLVATRSSKNVTEIV